MQRLKNNIILAIMLLLIWNVSTELGSILRSEKHFYKIEVMGAVHRPGMYYFEPGSRIIDAVQVAGGATEDADLESINLAQKLNKGDKIVVPDIFELIK